MKELSRWKLFLWMFGLKQVPLIGYVRPRLISLSEDKAVIKLPLRRRSKNHLNSMYFGALSIGADLAGGLHGFYHAKKANLSVSLAFKSFQAQFLSRPESDVFFVSQAGETVKNMLLESQQTGKRINQMIEINAYTCYPEDSILVASFSLELSLKIL